MKTTARLFIATLLALALQAQGAFTGISENTALPGDSITLTGTGINTTGSTAVILDGTSISPDSVSSTEITFTVPQGISSGALETSIDGEDAVDTGFSLRIDRQISGVFAPPSGVSLAGYEVLGTTLTTVDSQDGSFDLVLPLDSVLIVNVFRDEDDPIFQCVVHPDDASVTVNAESTALAQAFINPYVGTRNPTRASETLSLIRGNTHLAPLTSLIDAVAADGIDYLDDARFESNLIALLNELLDSSSQTASALPPTSHTHEINPDYAASIPATPVRLETTVKNPDETETGDYIVTIDSIARTPLDWAVEVYELNPNNYPTGRPSIDRLTDSSTPSFLSNYPVATGFVHAKLDGQKADLVERLANYVTELVYAEEEKVLKGNQFAFDGNESGVYVVQAYSGNLYYGTDFFTVTRNQVNLLNSVDKNDQWTLALAANITIAVIDLTSVLIDFTKFAPDDSDDLIQQIFIDATKAKSTKMARMD